MCLIITNSKLELDELLEQQKEKVVDDKYTVVRPDFVSGGKEWKLIGGVDSTNLDENSKKAFRQRFG